MYIYIYICIYVDLLPVALIISTGFSEGHVARRLQQVQFRLCVQIAPGSKFSDFARFWSQNPRILTPRYLEIALKSKQMAVPRQSSYQGRPKVMIFSKFHDFWTSKLDLKIIKIEFQNELEKAIAFGSQISWFLE